VVTVSVTVTDVSVTDLLGVDLASWSCLKRSAFSASAAASLSVNSFFFLVNEQINSFTKIDK